MKPRRLVFRGTVIAAAFWLDASVIGIAKARRRILEMPGVEEVRRNEHEFFVRLRNPVWVACDNAPGVPLVVCRGILIGAPLDGDEIDELAAPDGSVVLVRGGETVVIEPQSCSLEDLASWIDLSDWQVATVKPLGLIWTSPREAATIKPLDTREMAGIGALPQEAHDYLAKLKQSPIGGGSAPGRGFATSMFASVARFFSTIAGLFGRGQAPGPANPAVKSQALVASPTKIEPKSNWADRLRMVLNSTATKLLLWTNLISWVGRRQADYLEKTLSMFDSGNLEDALRHAIPLGTGDDKPKSLALNVPTPRADLSIHATKTEASSALGFGGQVFEALRTRYRRAVEQLEKQGKIKEAAFVLAELLGASEEAVSFLEKHGEYRLAAELAEGRNLDPALVIRQWILAGNRERAILIARRTGAFAAAIAKLEPSHPEQAAALRILWANQLASSGAYGAAVQTIWPVEQARHLARNWIDRGIEIGGPVGAKLLAAKAWLVPEEFASVVTSVRALPRTESEIAMDTWRALAQSVLANPITHTTRILARACLRQLVPHANDKSSKAIIERLVTASEDPVLSADVRRQTVPSNAPAAVYVRAAGLADVGLARDINEDAYLIAELETRGLRHYLETDTERAVPKRGFLFAVADGLGGYGGAEVAKLGLDTFSRCIETSKNELNAIGDALAHAVEEAGIVIYRRAAQDLKFRGSGSTITAAWLHEETLWIAQVGDTRAYLFRDDQLKQLTKDHSLMNELLDSGQLVPEEIASFQHSSIITRALGTVERTKVDIYRTRILDGDRLLFCTDGIHGVVQQDDIVHALRKSIKLPPKVACELLKKRAYDANAPDNFSLVVADIRIPRQTPSGRNVNSEMVTVDAITEALPSLLYERSESDIGTIAVFDAAVLPDGRLLVALGEAGVRLVSPLGKTLVHFDQPAERIVMSDHGDRAIVVIRRGEAWRTARIDLVRRRAERWFDANLWTFADSFDGSVWFVSNEHGMFALDALEENFASIWDIKEPERGILMGARSIHEASFRVGNEVWIIELPSFRMRAKRALPDVKATAHAIGSTFAPNGTAACWLRNGEESTSRAAFVQPPQDMWTSLAEIIDPSKSRQVALDDTGEHVAYCQACEPGKTNLTALNIRVYRVRDQARRIEIVLEGAQNARMRFQGSNLLICDDRGRVLVVNIRTHKTVGEWRI